MTPINPLYLVIPLLVAQITNTSNSSSTTLQTAIEREKANRRTDRFLPFDDLLDSLTRLDRCRLPRPFIPPSSERGKNRARGEVMRMDMGVEEEDEMDLEIERMRMKAGRVEDEQVDQGEGNEDVGRFCEVECVRKLVKGLCETQGKFRAKNPHQYLVKRRVRKLIGVAHLSNVHRPGWRNILPSIPDNHP